MYGVGALAGEFLIGDAVIRNSTHNSEEASQIRNEVILRCSIVETENLLIHVAEQVERLNGDICSFQSALEKASEILHPVCMNLSAHVAFGMVSNLMIKILVPQTLIGQHGESDSVDHKPCGFLCDTESTAKFIGTDSIFAVCNHPHGNHPLAHAERRVLEDCTYLDGELFLTALAKPEVTSRDERVLSGFASGTRNFPSGPAKQDRITKRPVRVREENHRLLEGFGKL